MYDRIIGPVPIDEEERLPSYDERTAKVRKDTGLDTIDQAQELRRKQDEVIVIDDDNSDVNGNLVRGVVVKEGLVGRFSVSR